MELLLTHNIAIQCGSQEHLKPERIIHVMIKKEKGYSVLYRVVAQVVFPILAAIKLINRAATQHCI